MWRSIGDLASDFVTLGALKVASRPPDEDHPFGHGGLRWLACVCVRACVCQAACTTLTAVTTTVTATARREV